MAKKSGGRGSHDAPFYKGGGGRIQPSPGYANDDGFGTPPNPGERGEAFGGTVPTGLKTPGRYSGLDKFTSKKGGRK